GLSGYAAGCRAGSGVKRGDGSSDAGRVSGRLRGVAGFVRKLPGAPPHLGVRPPTTPRTLAGPPTRWPRGRPSPYRRRGRGREPRSPVVRGKAGVVGPTREAPEAALPLDPQPPPVRRDRFHDHALRRHPD